MANNRDDRTLFLKNNLIELMGDLYTQEEKDEDKMMIEDDTDHSIGNAMSVNNASYIRYLFSHALFPMDKCRIFIDNSISHKFNIDINQLITESTSPTWNKIFESKTMFLIGYNLVIIENYIHNIVDTMGRNYRAILDKELEYFRKICTMAMSKPKRWTTTECFHIGMHALKPGVILNEEEKNEVGKLFENYFVDAESLIYIINLCASSKDVLDLKKIVEKCRDGLGLTNNLNLDTKQRKLVPVSVGF